MTKQRAVWVGIIIVLAVLPFVVRHYLAGLQRMPVQERPDYVHIEDILPVHEQRIKDRIDMLRQKTLDETFEYLLEDQQYFYPGFYPAADLVPRNIETILSTRSFLKVFQEFNNLPKEQVAEKLNVFYGRAIEKFGNILEIALLQDSNPSSKHPSPLHIEGAKMSTKYSLCVSMLLAASVGEYGLLLNQIDAMQRIIDTYVNRHEVVYKDIARDSISLEDDAFLTILMYALKQAKIDVPVDERVFFKKTIPLYRWDAALTHYDFEVVRQLRKPEPKDLVEQFDVYSFSGTDRFNTQKKKAVINTLKESLSK